MIGIAGLVVVAPGRWVAPLVAAGAVGIGLGLVRLLPVSLLPLGEQVRLQHELVSPLVPACVQGETTGLADVFGPCARGLVAWNLGRMAAWSPVWPGILLGLAGVGLLVRDRRALVLALPPATLLPVLPVVALQHRYLVPVAPFGAVLVALGALHLGRRLAAAAAPRRVPTTTLLGGAVAVFALAWNLGGPSLRDRAEDTPRGAGAGASLDRRGAPVLAADAVRAAWRPGEEVTDCAGANLRERLYPIPVAPVTGATLRDCRGLPGAPPGAPGWLLIRGGGPIDAGWTETALGGMRLLHAR